MRLSQAHGSFFGQAHPGIRALAPEGARRNRRGHHPGLFARPHQRRFWRWRIAGDFAALLHGAAASWHGGRRETGARHAHRNLLRAFWRWHHGHRPFPGARLAQGARRAGNAGAQACGKPAGVWRRGGGRGRARAQLSRKTRLGRGAFRHGEHRHLYPRTGNPLPHSRRARLRFWARTVSSSGRKGRSHLRAGHGRLLVRHRRHGRVPARALRRAGWENPPALARAHRRRVPRQERARGSLRHFGSPLLHRRKRSDRRGRAYRAL